LHEIIQYVNAGRLTLEDSAGLAKGAENADAVIHTAFDHDFANFVANCEKDRRVITALGSVLKGSSRPLLITSGLGISDPRNGEPAREDVFDAHHFNPRIASELAGQEQLAAGVNLGVVRLPQIHDNANQGLISPYINMAREKGVVAYVDQGASRWAAGHVSDVAKRYVLALDRAEPGARCHGWRKKALQRVISPKRWLPALACPPPHSRKKKRKPISAGSPCSLRQT
jgi:nucleoside-diphosphate-sugar epimerase